MLTCAKRRTRRIRPNRVAPRARKAERHLLARREFSELPQGIAQLRVSSSLGVVSALAGLNWGQSSDRASFLTTLHGERCDEDHIPVTGAGGLG